MALNTANAAAALGYANSDVTFLQYGHGAAARYADAQRAETLHIHGADRPEGHSSDDHDAGDRPEGPSSRYHDAGERPEGPSCDNDAGKRPEGPSCDNDAGERPEGPSCGDADRPEGHSTEYHPDAVQARAPEAEAEAEADTQPGCHAHTYSYKQPEPKPSSMLGDQYELDSADRYFSSALFAEVEELIGNKFTLDCFSLDNGDNALVNKYCCPENSFFDHDLKGEKCWINPPFNMIRDTLIHYHNCKNNDPSISAVFLMPRVNAAHPTEWAHLVKGMQHIKHFPRHSRIFVSVIDRHWEGTTETLTSSKADMVLYYDPPRLPETHNTITEQQQQHTSRVRTSHVMQANITLAGVTAMAIFDSGTEYSPIAPDGVYLSAKFAHRHHIHIRESSNLPALATVDGTELPVHGIATITMKIRTLIRQVKAIVMDMDDKLDCILSESWLTKHKAVMDYGSKTIVISNRGKPLVIRCVKPRVRFSSTPTKLLTMTQAKRVLRKKDTWYCLGMVQVVQEDASKDPTDPKVKILLKEYPTVFTDKPPKGGSNILAEFEVIPTEPGAKPTFRPMFRYSPLEKSEMIRKITELLELGYIEPSASPYGSPLMFVKKPRSEELRCVQDFRLLNKQTIRNKYPLPRIDDMIDAMSGAKVFSCIDLRDAYSQVKLQDSDKPNTAFSTPFGHYQWVTMSQGLTNAPAMFQSVVNDLFRPYLNKFVVVYLDDICIFSRTEEEHEKHLRLVLDILKSKNLTVAWHKCKFYQKELLFVGHIIGEAGVKADPAKVSAVNKYPQPSDVHQLRCFLGMSNYFRRFIHRYSEMVAPLNRLLRTGTEYIWGTEQQKAFDAVKTALTSAPVLKMPDWQSDKPFEICCDASYSGVAGVLMQDL